MGTHEHDHVEIAGGALVAALPAPPLEPYSLTVADAGGNADLHRSSAALDTAAPTRGARVLDHRAPPGAVRAGLAEAEQPLVVVEHPPAPTGRTGGGGGAGPGARAVTGLARGVTREVDRRGDTADGILEGQVQLGLEVSTALRPGSARARTAPPPPTAVEEAAEQVAQVADVAQVVGGEGGATGTAEPAARAAEPARHRAESADLVVLLALLGVTHHVVGGRHLLEPLLGRRVLVGVGVVLARQLPVGLGDVLLRGLGVHAERLVVVLLEPLALRRHRRPRWPGVGPVTRRGRSAARLGGTALIP